MFNQDYRAVDRDLSSPNFEAIPAELKARHQWVTWRIEPNIDTGKLTKVPYRAVGDGKASPTDASTWSTFEQAQRRYTERGDVDGVGFVFTEDDPYCGIDFDHCIDENERLSPDVDINLDGLDSYTEVSPSGTGLHVITRAVLPSNVKTDPIELYDRKRFFTFTGNRWPGTPAAIRECQNVIDYLHAEATEARPTPAPTRQPASGPTLAETDILNKLRLATNSGKFTALFDRGDTSDYNGDTSRADLALCSCVSFYSSDPALIDSIYRQSALYRDKWDEIHQRTPTTLTYGEMTIQKALQRAEVYTPSIPVTLVSGKASKASVAPQNGNLALAPSHDHSEATTAKAEPAAPIRLSMADVWQRDLIALGAPPETPPEREYILEFLSVPSVNLWTGLPGGKKSLLLQDAAMAEASGQLWLPRKGDTNAATFGDVQGQGRPVLWIDYDMGRDLTTERFYAMARSRGIPDLSHVPLHILSVSAPMDLYSLQHSEDLAELIRRLGVKFVVIDTLIDVKGPARENEDSMGVVFSNIRRISQEARCSINVIHHPAKNGNPDTPYRGFSGIAGKLDLGVSLAKRGHEASEPVDAAFFKVRGAPPKPFSAMLQYETHPADWRVLWHTSFVAIAPSAGVLGVQAIRETFQEILGQEQGLGKTELINRVHAKLIGQKVSKAEVQAQYYALLSDEQVTAESTGKDNKVAHAWVDR